MQRLARLTAVLFLGIPSLLYAPGQSHDPCSGVFGVITAKCHRPWPSKPQYALFTALKAGKSKIKALVDLVSDEGLFPCF